MDEATYVGYQQGWRDGTVEALKQQHVTDAVSAPLLAEWLLANGFAEEKRGYGHVSAVDLAVAILDRFSLTLRHNDGVDSDG